jgi:FixJ family two-component response regulator
MTMAVQNEYQGAGMLIVDIRTHSRHGTTLRNLSRGVRYAIILLWRRVDVNITNRLVVC